MLVYISCYVEPPGHFGYELKLPPPPGDDFPHQVAGHGMGWCHALGALSCVWAGKEYAGRKRAARITQRTTDAATGVRRRCKHGHNQHL